MFRLYVLSFVTAFSVTGCLGSGSVSQPKTTTDRTVTVPAGDPFITLDDGSRIGVEGLGDDQHMKFTATEFIDGDGRIGVDWDVAEQ